MNENGGRKLQNPHADPGAAWRGLLSLAIVCATVVAVVWIIWG